jgi:HEAT repeat protein
MLQELLQTLVESKNEAADDVLLEALRLGTEAEKNMVLGALLQRRTLVGLMGVVGQYGTLSAALQGVVIQNVRLFHSALREAGRSEDVELAHSAMRLIALGRQGKLTYVLIEGLHSPHESVSRAAVEAMVALARWASTETRRLQREAAAVLSREPGSSTKPLPPGVFENELQGAYHHLMDDRPEIEQAVARALDVHRGKYGPELTRAALLLADWPGSKTFAVLSTPKHGGQTALLRRLQQPPDSEHVEAFLLAATHAGLRSHFGIVMSHIEDAPVLDALLRRAHWLKDHQLQVCMHQVTRGVWWNDGEFEKDLSRRGSQDIASVAEFLGSSGLHDVVQDHRLAILYEQLENHPAERLRLLRVALRRPRGASVGLLRVFLSDPDERLARIAARDIVRRKPADFENILIQVMSGAAPSVRRVISRAVGHAGFEQFWGKFERLDKNTRKAAGRAMLKLMPDGVQRLERRLRSGPADQRLKAITVAQELGMGEALTPALISMCHDPNSKIRSKAVAVLAQTQGVAPDALLEKVLNDDDARVRANAIEVIEARNRVDFIPLLAKRARSSSSRERANAIKALHRMRVGTASTQLSSMIQDERAEHRISAMWALKQIGWWQMLHDVGRLAKEDPNLRVRRYAMTVLKGVSEIMQMQKKLGKKAG